MSQPELARRVGISQPSMHNIEAGKTKTLRGDTLAGLCRVLNVHPDAILHGADRGGAEAMLHESELLAIWRALTPADQEHLLAVARALAGRMVPRKAVAPPKPDKTYTTEAGSLGT